MPVPSASQLGGSGDLTDKPLMVLMDNRDLSSCSSKGETKAG